MHPSAPLLIAYQGRLAWQHDDGTIRPYIGGGADDGDEKKFTQADVEKLIQERVARVKAEPPADYDKLKADSAELATLKTAAETEKAKNRTEAEATAARIAALEASVAASTEAVNAAKADALEEKRRSAVVAAAAAAKVVKPEQVLALLPKDAVTIGDDGQVTGAVEAVTKFVTENPHFVGTATPSTTASRHQGKDAEAKGFGAGGKAEAAKRFPTADVVGAAGTGQQK